jgi:predicted ATP-grasp superfamily ATP-dependent carboligase
MRGADSELFWSATYIDADGRPLALWTGRKLRQYPRRFGSSTLAESRWEPTIAQETVDILKAAGHRGLAFAEFKRDGRDGRFKLTEVTAGRTWFPHALVTRSGINLPLIMYRDMLGLDPEVQPAYVQGIKWIHEERDLKTVLRYFIPEGELTVWSWLQSYRGKRVYALAAWDDPKPILITMRRVAKAGWRRVKRRLSSPQAERAGRAARNPSTRTRCSSPPIPPRGIAWGAWTRGREASHGPFADHRGARRRTTDKENRAMIIDECFTLVPRSQRNAPGARRDSAPRGGGR